MTMLFCIAESEIKVIHTYIPSHAVAVAVATATCLKKHIVSYQMSPKVSLLGYRKRLETLCCQILCQLYCQCESCFQHIYVMLCDDFCGNVYVCLSI